MIHVMSDDTPALRFATINGGHTIQVLFSGVLFGADRRALSIADACDARDRLDAAIRDAEAQQERGNARMRRASTINGGV